MRKLKVKAKRPALGYTGRNWVPFWEVGSRILTQNKSGSALSQGLLRLPDPRKGQDSSYSAAMCGFCPGHSQGTWVSLIVNYNPSLL